MHGLALFKTVAVAALILANAFFVAAEFALVSIRETRIEQLLAAGVPGARAVRRLQSGIEDLLPAVQLGVTLCSLALGWIGEPLAQTLLQPLLPALGHPVYSRLAALVIGFALITYFHVVVGELVPKSLALRRAEGIAVAIAPPMLAFISVTRPLVRLLRGSASAVLRGFDVPLSERAAVHSADELKLIATAARRMGLLPPFQETLIHRAVELDEVPVREVMTPRQKIFSLPSAMTVQDAMARILAHHRSRIPVYDETRGPEHIVGVVYARDLARIEFFRRTSAQTPAQPGIQPQTSAAGPLPVQPNQVELNPVQLRLGQIMRDVLVVPETKSVLDLLQEFKRRRRHLAIVVDEFGSIVGLVTAEDAIEQLAGELEDEFDIPTQPLLPSRTGPFTMDGGVNLRDLETQMQWNLPRDGGVETLAGFMLFRLGHIPQAGESVVYEGRRLTVLEMDGRRIARILVEPAGQPESSPLPRRRL
ncbi:MAG TPA: hemolysin family protein [Terracidiphilus sp.]|jgi:putative hemolysin|nr:hemolysin family protein [Terracidiphilus sp.]